MTFLSAVSDDSFLLRLSLHECRGHRTYRFKDEGDKSPRQYHLFAEDSSRQGIQETTISGGQEPAWEYEVRECELHGTVNLRKSAEVRCLERWLILSEQNEAYQP